MARPSAPRNAHSGTPVTLPPIGKATRKRPTNVTIRGDLLQQARALSINLSHEFENHLEQVIRKRRAAQWLVDNQPAIEAYNRFVEKHGIWNEEFRGW